MLLCLNPRKPSLPKLYKARTQIESWLLNAEVEGQPLEGALLDRFVNWLLKETIRKELGIDDIGDESAVVEEDADTEFRDRCQFSLIGLLRGFVGKTLTREQIRKLAITVSGRSPEFGAGKPCQMWNGVGALPGMLFFFDIRRLEQQERIYEVGAEVHTGMMAGMRWFPRMSGTYIQVLLRQLGAKLYEDWHDEDISGLWLQGTMRYEKNRLCVSAGELPESMSAYNRKLTNSRKGVCKGPSERKGKACTVCECGRQQCGLARFAAPYAEIRECAHGHKGWFRYEDQTRCLTCLRNGRIFLPTQPRSPNPSQ